MPTPRMANILATLESFHGTQQPFAPTDPYEFLIWWHCGYPPSEARCATGWQALTHRTGIAPKQLAAASRVKLAAALKAGGMVPGLRAARLKEIATRVQDEYSGNLRAVLELLPAAQARKLLKSFPGIGNPGADRILLFGRFEAVAAVPSACPHVLVRVLHGARANGYTADYAAAQRILNTLPAEIDARIRGYLLISRHGQALCKRSHPDCPRCPLRACCAFAKGANQRR